MRAFIAFLAGIAFTLAMQILFSRAVERVSSPIEVFTAHYPNGGLKFRREYRAGKPDGQFVEYYENGQVRLVTQYRSGLQEGDYREFRSDGSRFIEANYVAGMLHGNYEEFAESDSLREKSLYERGLLHGSSKTYRSDGSIERNRLFKLGELISRYEFDLAGQIRYSIKRDVRDGVETQRLFDQKNTLLGVRERQSLSDDWVKLSTSCSEDGIIETLLCQRDFLRYRSFRLVDKGRVGIGVFSPYPNPIDPPQIVVRLLAKGEVFEGVAYGISRLKDNGKLGKSDLLRVRAGSELSIESLNGEPLGAIVSNNFEQTGTLRWNPERLSSGLRCSQIEYLPRTLPCKERVELWKQILKDEFGNARKSVR